MSRRSWLCLLLLLAGCGRRGEEPAIGEGFVAPATLNLRQELGPRQPSVASVRHGERVEILANRRRFVKVRTRSGAVGWTDSALLFTPQQMEELHALGEQAAKLPSQGDATVLDTLNVHTQPERNSPSFQQIREGEHVAVVGHRLTVRTPAELPPDDWSMVRLSQSEAGWVLTRMLYMTMPDEVAQYAEGHRITSYFSLGEIKDGEQVKRNWLWTTITTGREPYEFDSFRVFVWSLRRHRYETAYIERNLKGYYPVTVDRPGGAPPRFSLIIEDKEGTRLLRTYTFQGYHVRLVSKVPWNPPAPPAKPAAAAPGPQPPSPSWFARVRAGASSAWRSLFHRRKQ
jgi:hypothetical protein